VNGHVAAALTAPRRQPIGVKPGLNGRRHPHRILDTTTWADARSVNSAGPVGAVQRPLLVGRRHDRAGALFVQLPLYLL